MDVRELAGRVRRREIYRYMGMKEEDAGESLRALVEEQLIRLLNQIRVRSFYQIFPLSLQEGERTEIELGPLHIVSRDLGRNLRGCTSAALFGATLGMEADRLLYRLGLTAVGEAVVTDACAAEVLEVVCDEVCGELAALAKQNGERIRPRYSPGFGDFTLAYQAELLKTLELPKRLGVSLTAGGMLTPTKTVTAVVGFLPAEHEKGQMRTEQP